MSHMRQEVQWNWTNTLSSRTHSSAVGARNTTPPKLPAADSDHVFTCAICPRAFNKRANVRAHSRKHTGETHIAARNRVADVLSCRSSPSPCTKPEAFLAAPRAPATAARLRAVQGRPPARRTAFGARHRHRAGRHAALRAPSSSRAPARARPGSYTRSNAAATRRPARARPSAATPTTS